MAESQSARNKKLKWYERQYVVDPKAQLKIIFFLGGIAIISATAICFVAYERLNQLGILFNRAVVPPALLPEAFRELARSLMFRLSAIVALMVLYFVIAGVMLTHRVAGPIWKLQEQLKQFFDGEDIRPLSFRKRDEFQELPGLINRLMENYKGPRGK